jgi:hypothetical protein
MQFDWNINLGNLISVAVLILSVWKYGSKQHKENQEVLRDIRFKVNLMWRWYKQDHGMNGDHEE